MTTEDQPDNPRLDNSRPGNSRPAAGYVPDLMDRSKVSGSFPDIVMAKALDADAFADAMTQAGTQAEPKVGTQAPAQPPILLVDLKRPAALEVIAELRDRGTFAPDDGPAWSVVGFGSHVDAEVLAAAEACGCTEVLARSVFFRRLTQGGFSLH